MSVHFVGAGPGAVDLITVRGMKLIKNADVIIYAGSLVNPELLNYASEDAKVYDSSRMTLDEVIGVMKEACDKGLDVVRLHTGDQSLYGAVREQMDQLDSLGISYDSCPGVSAAFGAAASLNLEYTLPDVSQTLILTRTSGKTGVPERESIQSLASHRASMAVYLSSSLLDKLSKELVEGGYAPGTPAAIVYKASWPEERTYMTTVGELAKTGEENGITKTAIVLVGDAVQSSSYSKSKLYDPSWSTEYRKGTDA